MFNVTGTRLGIIIVPDPLVDKIIKNLCRDIIFPSPVDQMTIRDNMKSALDPYAGTEHNFYEFTRRDINQRVKWISKALQKFEIRVIQCEGSYYIILDLEAWRNRLEEKYFYKLDDKDVKTEELDKAVARALFLEGKVGILPFSVLYMGKPSPPDNLARLPVNRNDEDLNLFVSVVQKVYDGLKRKAKL